MEFNAANVLQRTKKLREEFGSAKKLAEAAGCSLTTVNNYCSKGYLEKYHPRKKTWEKYFGPWDTDTDTTQETKESTIEDKEQQKAEPEKEEPASFPMEKKGSKLIIEADNLEELTETLSTFGFRLEFVPM